jgi:hypothetical protein
MATKPPIGLIPKFVRDRERAIEILEAMRRYIDAGQSVPRSWLVELMELDDIYAAPDQKHS